jgi:hypothetical protein
MTSLVALPRIEERSEEMVPTDAAEFPCNRVGATALEEPSTTRGDETGREAAAEKLLALV